MSIIEWYKQDFWFKQHKWLIKPHNNRSEHINWEGKKCLPECAQCKKHIKYGEKAYYCLTNPIRLRPYGYGKVCYECGNKIMEEAEKT